MSESSWKGPQRRKSCIPIQGVVYGKPASESFRKIDPDSEEGKRILRQALRELPKDFGTKRKKGLPPSLWRANFEKRPQKVIEAFDEEKTVAEWVSDPRCRCCSKRTLRTRIYNGWEPEKAIKTPYTGMACDVD